MPKDVSRSVIPIRFRYLSFLLLAVFIISFGFIIIVAALSGVICRAVRIVSPIRQINAVGALVFGERF